MGIGERISEPTHTQESANAIRARCASLARCTAGKGVHAYLLLRRILLAVAHIRCDGGGEQDGLLRAYVSY